MIILGAPIDHNVVHQADNSWSVLQNFVHLQLIVLWSGVYTEGEATVAVASKRVMKVVRSRESCTNQI